MNKLLTILEAYRNGERDLPGYAELMEISQAEARGDELSGTPLSDQLERTRIEMRQERTPAYGDALSLCRRLERALAGTRPAAPQAGEALTLEQARSLIDYRALIEAAWRQHTYAQGTSGCIAFKHGAEWAVQQYASQPMSREGMSQAAHDVLAERRRQIEAEGWTPEHDDAHHDGTLAQAAGCYATWAFEGEQLPNWVPTGWAWADSWWKPSTPRLNLIRAGALILAELERLDRASVHGIGSVSGTGASHD